MTIKSPSDIRWGFYIFRLYFEVSHQSFVTGKFSSFLRFRNILQKEIPKFITIHILCKIDIDCTHSLFLQPKAEKNRPLIVIYDGKIFDRRIIIESSINIDTVFIHRYLRYLRSIILHHKIDSNEYENDDGKSIESDENPPYDEGERENSSGRVPTWTFCVLSGDIPREHRK